MAWLLDTNILSEGRKPRPDPRVTAFYDREPLSELYISILSIAEIRFGIELQEDAARRAELNEWLTLTLRPTFAGRILPVTEDILLKWRLLMEGGERSGHIFTPGPCACGDCSSPWVYGCHARPERFRQGGGTRVQPVGAVSPSLVSTGHCLDGPVVHELERKPVCRGGPGLLPRRRASARRGLEQRLDLVFVADCCLDPLRTQLCVPRRDSSRRLLEPLLHPPRPTYPHTGYT